MPSQNFRRPRFVAITFALVFCGTFFATIAGAEHTRSWRQSSYEEFLKGTSNGVAVRSDGRLELSPKFTLLADADASFLWTLRTDPKGVLYAAGGSPAKVFRIDASGKPAKAFEATDLAAQAIAFDAKGNLYVGTSPDGKVYRVSPSGEKSVFFDPKTKYIWDLAFGQDGALYVATGDKGQIFVVSPDGKSELYYASDEAHIRVVAFDAKGNLLVGTEPSGRVLRLTKSATANARKDKEKEPAAEGFVLYETSKREITALAVAPDGNIYVAAIGEKQHAGSPSTTIISTSGGATTITGGGVISGPAGQAPSPFVPFPPLLSGAIYKIAADGAPEELWTSRDDVVYSLALNAEGRLLAGTGNNGALLAVDGRGVFAQLAKAGSAQITSITRGPNGKIFLCTANPGKVFSVGPEYQPEGTYESRSFDAGLFSKWGRLDWWSPPPTAPNTKSASNATSAEPRLEFFVRSGNTEDPGKEWSRWYGPYTKPSAVEAPPARFAQWKAIIHDGRYGDGIEWVTLAYLPRNVAPVIDGIAVQDPNVRVQGAVAIQSGQQPSVALKSPPAPNPTGVVISPSSSPRFEQPPQGFQQKGSQSVLWTAHDDNEDDLRYTVLYRAENEKEWKVLKDKLAEKFYTWDATALPDSAYYLRIVASDALSNPPADALATSRDSDRFVIDNTPPTVERLESSVVAAQRKDATNTSQHTAALKFTARDSTSSIDRAQYSIDGGDWVMIAPIGGVSDSVEERYEFTLPEPLSPGEHSIAVRAYDHFENVGSAKTIVNIPGKQ